MGREPFLDLHFDVANTIFTVDPNRKRWDGYPMRLTDHIVRILAERTWGSDDSGKWEWNGAPPSLKGKTMGEITYATYLEEVTEGDDNEYHKLLEAFTDSGHPGEMLSLEIAPMLCTLLLPPEVAETSEARDAGLISDHAQLLPSFFTLLRHLNDADRSFAITLRGFGTEVKLAGQELTSFCQGSHPIYADESARSVCLNGGKKEVCVREGVFERDGSGVSLTLGGGVFTKAPSAFSVKTERGYKAVARVMSGQAKDGFQRYSVLQDSQKWWDASESSSDSGKFFPLRRRESEVHAIFFDANGATQVDSRDEDGDHIEYEEVRDVHVIVVDPLKAMSDESYFLDMLQAAESKYNQDMGCRAPSMTFGLTEVF